MRDKNDHGGIGSRLGSLAHTLSEKAARGHPPVEQWNPPYCGNIGLEIRSGGDWYYQGSPLTRESLVKLFSSVLRKDADGKTYLVTPEEKVDVLVSDAPFVAVEMEMTGQEPHQSLIFRTNVDDVVICGPKHPLRFTVDEQTGSIRPYLLVRGRLEALLTRALTHELLDLAVKQDPPGIRSGGLLFLVPDVPAAGSA